MNRLSHILMRRTFIIWTFLLSLWFWSAQSASAAKNVILMIADGAGQNTWAAASMYQGKLGKQIYDQPGWVRLSCCTFPLSRSTKPEGTDLQETALIYNPTKAWDAAALVKDKNQKYPFAGYEYLAETPTDSAAAATAMSTGCKTYDNAINWSNEDRPYPNTIAQIAKSTGRSVGVITTVQWSHATPAGLGGAHNISRNNYSEIAKEMLDCDWLDVIMGAGNPDFDDDGQPISPDKKIDYQYVGGEITWKELKQGSRPWKLIENKADYESLTSGNTPAKVLGVAQVATTLQEKRGKNLVQVQDGKKTPPEPFAVPLVENVPSLATLSKAALNCLDDNPKGFYLMIEGGAVDWANHAREPERMIEEQVDFLHAVEAVVAWIENHGGWDQNLLILTADHECGMVWGPNSDTIAFDPIVDQGAGKMPLLKHNLSNHTNSLVPLYVRGCGVNRLSGYFAGKDEKAAAIWQYSGQYIDNTDIFTLMRAELTQTPGQ